MVARLYVVMFCVLSFVKVLLLCIRHLLELVKILMHLLFYATSDWIMLEIYDSSK